MIEVCCSGEGNSRAGDPGVLYCTDFTVVQSVQREESVVITAAGLSDEISELIFVDVTKHLMESVDFLGCERLDCSLLGFLCSSLVDWSEIARLTRHDMVDICSCLGDEVVDDVGGVALRPARLFLLQKLCPH